MMNLAIRMRGAVVAISLAAAIPAFAGDTSSDFDHKVDFRTYRTFSFYKVKTSNPFAAERLKDEVTRDLTKAGLERVDSGGDLAITAIGQTRNTKQYETFYNGLGGGGYGWGGWGGWYGGGWGGPGDLSTAQTTERTIPVGTLVLDMYDTKTKQLVWRGRARRELSDKSDKNAKKLKDDIDHMLNGFPPKFKG